jgi:hypothetical protein
MGIQSEPDVRIVTVRWVSFAIVRTDGAQGSH